MIFFLWYVACSSPCPPLPPILTLERAGQAPGIPRRWGVLPIILLFAVDLFFASAPRWEGEDRSQAVETLFMVTGETSPQAEEFQMWGERRGQVGKPCRFRCGVEGGPAERARRAMGSDLVC